MTETLQVSEQQQAAGREVAGRGQQVVWWQAAGSKLCGGRQGAVGRGPCGGRQGSRSREQLVPGRDSA